MGLGVMGLGAVWGGVVDVKVWLRRMIGGVVEAWFDLLLSALSVRKFAAGQNDLN